MLRIAVSALRRGENPEPGPAVINSIRRKHLDAWIVGFSYDPLDSGLYVDDDVDGRERINRGYLMPLATKGPSALLERIDGIIQDQPLDMIIPNQDFEIPNYLDIVGELNKRGIKLGIPSRSAFERRGKENLYKLCESARVKSPKTVPVDSVEAAQDAAAEIGFPVMIKGRMYGAAQASAPIDVAPVYHHMHALYGGPLLVQELIEGEDEFSVLGVGDGCGNVVGMCNIRKVLITSTGKTFSGIVIRNSEMLAATERVVKALKWYGPFELEFIGGTETGYSLIEMNPRFSSWVDFPSQIGCNLVSALVDMTVNGSSVSPMKPCEPGKMFIRHSIDVAGDITMLAHLVDKGELHRGCEIPPRQQEGKDSISSPTESGVLNELQNIPVDPKITYPSYKSFDDLIDVERLRSLDGYLTEKIKRHMRRSDDAKFHTGPLRLDPAAPALPGSRMIYLAQSEVPDSHFDYFDLDKTELWHPTIHADEFALLMDFIKTLPFQATGRMLVIYDTVARAGTAHRDHDMTDICHEFLWFRTNFKKPFYMLNHKTNEKKYVTSYSAWFDSVNQYHGSDAVDGLSFSIRVDGKFTDEFRAMIPKPEVNKASTPSYWASLAAEQAETGGRRLLVPAAKRRRRLNKSTPGNR